MNLLNKWNGGLNRFNSKRYMNNKMIIVRL